MRRKPKPRKHAQVVNNAPVDKKRFELTTVHAVIILIVLLVVVVAIIIGARLWLLLSVPVILVTVGLSMWSDLYTKPPALLNAMKSFFTYATVGVL